MAWKWRTPREVWVGKEEGPGLCPEQCQKADKDEVLQVEEAGDTPAGNNVTKKEKAWL